MPKATSLIKTSILNFHICRVAVRDGAPIKTIVDHILFSKFCQAIKTINNIFSVIHNEVSFNRVALVD